jgi:hypothetical protein
MLMVSPDVLNPMSDDLMRAMKLEVYDRAIANPLSDQEAVYEEFLLGAYPDIIKDPKQFMIQPETMAPGMPGMPGGVGMQPGQLPQGQEGTQNMATPSMGSQVQKSITPNIVKR